MSLYKQHHGDVLKRGIPNQALFEAYVQYCFSPKHTVGEQLLDVRRDKRERAAYAAAVGDFYILCFVSTPSVQSAFTFWM